MASYTISGAVTEPDNVTPWRGFYYIGIYSDTGIAIDVDGSWRAGLRRVPIDSTTGAASITLPESTGGELYVVTYESFSGDKKGPWVFALTANRTWASVIESPVPLPVDPSWLEEALAAAAAAAASVIQDRKAIAREPGLIIKDTVTRDGNGAATSAAVKWPDGSVGTYTADTLSVAFPGAVDGYHITYGSPVTNTYTQPTITRDGTGAAVTVPEIVVS